MHPELQLAKQTDHIPLQIYLIAIFSNPNLVDRLG